MENFTMFQDSGGALRHGAKGAHFKFQENIQKAILAINL